MATSKDVQCVSYFKTAKKFVNLYFKKLRDAPLPNTLFYSKEKAITGSFVWKSNYSFWNNIEIYSIIRVLPVESFSPEYWQDHITGDTVEISNSLVSYDILSLI